MAKVKVVAGDWLYQSLFKDTKYMSGKEWGMMTKKEIIPHVASETEIKVCH